MKYCWTLLSLFVLFHKSLQAQENQKLDSLLQLYTSMSDDVEKVNLLDHIYDQTLFAKTSKDAFIIAQKQLKIATRIKYVIGKGKAYHNHANYFRNIYEFDSARYYYKKSLDIWNVTNYPKGLYSTFYGWGKIEQLSGNFDLALAKYDSLIRISLQLNIGRDLALAKREKATVYMDKSSYKLAIAELLEALKILDSCEKKDLRLKADLLVGLGRTETLRENYLSALKPLNEGLDIFENLNDPVWIAIAQIELGLAHMHLGELYKSEVFFSKSLNYSLKHENKVFEAISLMNLGITYRKKGDLKKSLEHLNKTLNIGKSSSNNLAATYNEIGNTYLDGKKYSKAIENYSKAIKISDSTENTADLKNAYQWRSKAYEESGKYKNSLIDHKQFQLLKDSIFNTTKSKQIEELRTIYDTEKKEQQIALQEKEITVLEQKEEISTLQKIVLGSMLIVSLFGFYGIRQKLKRNKLEKERVDVELAFKKKELTTHALNLARKNETLENLKVKAQELKEKETTTTGYNQLIRSINFDLQDDNNWENFSRYFEQVHKDFNSNIKSKYPEVTSNELRLMALLKMNLSSKEIANILNISPEGIKKARYRLRKKLDITTEDSLQDLVLSL